MVTPIAVRLKGIEQLSRLFQRRPRPSWTHRAHFSTNRIHAVGRTEIRVAYDLHVVPPGGNEGAFRSSVTVWTKGRRRRVEGRTPWNVSPSKPGGWNSALLRLGWYQECEQLLRRYGYRGKWRHSPWGRFGDFWKSHEDPPSLLKEVELFETLSDERVWGRRRTMR